jgi:hypothetical protein
MARPRRVSISWFEKSNPSLKGSTPLQVIERGESDRIWRIVWQLREGHVGDWPMIEPAIQTDPCGGSRSFQGLCRLALCRQVVSPPPKDFSSSTPDLAETCVPKIICRR